MVPRVIETWLRRWPREHFVAVGLAVLAGVVALAVSTWVFPYRSINHDEAVYLQQAAMLLDGKLFLRPPVPEAFRPWFFVRDGVRLYPKYAPLPAALFALGELAGGYHLSLVAIAAATAGLTYAVVAEVFDVRRGLLAAGLLLASPLFLIQSGVFLPYLPTAALNLAFALAYLRADRTGSLRWAATAGAAIGLAFFTRPYTAVLFAAPFVVHALWTLRDRDRRTVRRQGVTAALGLAGVALALGYNTVVTGSPLLFPYEAFDPGDGLGFGRRSLLGYTVEYTPGLALRANAEVLWTFFAGWVVAGPVGTALAAVGLGGLLVRLRRVSDRRSLDPDDARGFLILGVLVSVAVGNCYFWGNLNVLGQLSAPGDGLISYVGPYYHVDLLLPTVAFAADGLLRVSAWLRETAFGRLGPDRARGAWLAALAVSTAALGGIAVVTAAGPIQDDLGASRQLARAYEPIEDGQFEDAVVFLPTPYGDWLNHPFQALRNDPGYDGEVLYAVEERPFQVAAAFPDRTLYRYSYRGAWNPTVGGPVDPTVRRIRVVESERLRVRATLGVPARIERVSIRLAAGEGSAYFVGNASRGRLPIELAVTPAEATLDGSVRPTGRSSVALDGADEVVVEAFLEDASGGGVTYRIRLPVASGDGPAGRTAGTVRAISPHLEACLEPLRCGGEAAYVGDGTPPDVSVDAELSANGSA